MKKYFLLFLLLVMFTGLTAQQYNVSVQHVDMKDGLSHHTINIIFQDSRGFVWFSTVNGLNRYDGYSFIIYNKENGQLPINDVGDIREDKAGNMWVRLRGGYVAIINVLTNKIRCFKEGKVPDSIAYPNSDSSFQIEQWKNWFYTVNDSVFQTRPLVQIDSTNEFVTATDRNTILLIKNKRELIEKTQYGKILRKVVFPAEVGFFFLDRTGGSMYVKSPDERIFFIDTVFQVTEITRKILPVNKDFYFDNIYYTGVDDIMFREGKLWSLKNGLIYDLAKDGIKPFRYRYGKIRAYNGKFWIGTNDGFYIVSITRNKFRKIFSKMPGSTDEKAFRGLLAVNNKLYAADQKSGVYECSGINSTITTKKLYESHIDDYTAVIKSSEGKIISARRRYVYVTDLVNYKTDSFKLTCGAVPLCWAIYEVLPGKFLLGLWKGLVWFDISTGKFTEFTQFGKYKELINAFVLAIQSAQNGNLLLCTNNGIYELNKSYAVIGRYSATDTGINYLPAKEFQHIHQDRNGIYWIASTVGLISWDKVKGTSKLFTQKNGLSNNNIYAVYGDKFNRLWLSSDNGIMQFDKATNKVIAYLEEDGIASNEFNRLSHCMDSLGNIYFGSISGITHFNPADFPVLSNNNNGSPLVIASFNQFDETANTLIDKTSSLLQSGVINMYANDRFFDIQFSLLNYENVKYNTYYWRIAGIDKDWNQQKDRNIRLSRLPYGNFILEIKAQEANGTWSKNTLQIQLNVIKPFYLRTWFLLTMVVLLIDLVVFIFKRRTYLLRKENIRLDRMVQEKTNDLITSLEEKDMLLKEIHHRVKNNLQVINSLLYLQSRTVKEQAAKDALIESQNRVMSIALIHQKLYQNQDNKLDKVEFSKFAEDLFVHLNNIFTTSSIVVFTNNINQVHLKIDTAVPLALILNELLTNSFKYAFNNNAKPAIEVSIGTKEKYSVLTYTDNGPGLPKEVELANNKSMGMRLITRLASQLHGKAVFSNNNGFVCEIMFTEDRI